MSLSMLERERAVRHAVLLAAVSVLLGSAAPSQVPTCPGQTPGFTVTGGRFGDPWSIFLSGPPGAAALIGADPVAGPIATPFGTLCLGLSPGLSTVPVTLDALGNFATGGMLPLNGGGIPAGFPLSMQAAIANPALPGGVGLTTGWNVTFRPPRLGVFSPGNIAWIDPITDAVASSAPAAVTFTNLVMRVPRLGWFAVPKFGGALDFIDDATGATALSIPGLLPNSAQYYPIGLGLFVASDGSKVVRLYGGGFGPPVMVTVHALPSGAPMSATTIPTDQFQSWAYPIPGSSLVYVADPYWIRVVDAGTGTIVSSILLPGTVSSTPLQVGNLLYASTASSLFAIDVTTHAIVMGPVPTGQPNTSIAGFGPGPAGPALFASGGSTATGFTLTACSPVTLAVQSSVPFPDWFGMQLSSGGTEWLLAAWNPTTSQSELRVMNPLTLQHTLVLPSIPYGITVLRSGTLTKTYAGSSPTTLVPIPTDPIGTPGAPITLPVSGVVLSN